jgi:Protein of unknown function (DUF1257)
MSHFATISTQITSQECLIQALQDIHLTDVHVHETAQAIRNYYGQHEQLAHIVVNPPTGRAQIGFVRNIDGCFSVIEDKYETDRYIGINFVNSMLMPRYVRHLITEQAEKMKVNTGSYNIEESIAEDGCHKYRLRFTNQQKQVIRR